jgi:RNA polymerase-binding transcription factor DksA
MHVKNHKLAFLGIPSKWKRHYRNLLALREDLQADRMNETNTLRDAHDIPEGDELDHRIMLTILSNAKDPLSEIEAAIQRIKNGTYGICQESGKPIPEARLRVVPWTRYTMEVLERKERAQAGSSRRRPDGRDNLDGDHRFALILQPEIDS